MIYLAHPNYRHYQDFYYNEDSVCEVLGEETDFYFSRIPESYTNRWKKVEIKFKPYSSKKTPLPDVFVRNGRLFLNEKAVEVLKPLIESQGEFLPVTYEGGQGMLFNILATAEEVDGVDQAVSFKNEYGEMVSIGFHEDRVKGLHVFRTKFDKYMSVYCSEEFKQAVESAGLNGLVFSVDIGNIFPPDPNAKTPTAH